METIKVAQHGLWRYLAHSGEIFEGGYGAQRFSSVTPDMVRQFVAPWELQSAIA